MSQDAVIRNAAILETNVLGNVTPGVTYGGVQIQADHIEIAGILPVPAPLGVGGTGIRSNVGTDAQPNSGNSGNISLSANSITMKGDAILETNVQGIPQPPGAPAPTSKAGDITLTANNNIELNGTTIQTHLTFDSGSAGNITLTSKHGSILETGNSIPFGFVPTPGAPIPPLTLNLMFNQSLSSAGKPGNYTFNAPEGNIQIAGGLIGVQIAPVIPGTPVQGAGGGQVNITANNLGLINFSSVQMDNFSGSPVGNFNVTLNGNLMVNSSRIITTARAAAPAAALNIAAHDVRTKSYAEGYLGHLYETEHRYDEGLQLTRQAIFSAQAASAPESLYRWEWQLGRLLADTGKLDEAITAYYRAADVLKPIRMEVASAMSIGAISGEESIKSLFFEQADLLFQRATRTADEKPVEDYLRHADERS